MREVSEELKQQLLNKRLDENNPATCTVSIIEVIEGVAEFEYPLPQIIDVNVFTSESNFSNNATVRIANINPDDMSDFGYFNPHRNHPQFNKPQNSWYKRIVPGAKIRIKMGYGEELQQVFNGIIDSVTMGTEVDRSYLEINARDRARELMTRAANCIEDGHKVYYIFYPLDLDVESVYLDHEDEDPDLSDVVFDICRRAGFPFSDIQVEPTGINISDTAEGMFEFENQNWDSCINRIRDICNFDFWVDEYGKANFKRPLEKSIDHTQETLMFGDPPEPQPMEKIGIISSSIIVKDHADPEIIYQRDIDYSYDEVENTIIRLVSGSIPEDQWVYVSYSHVAWKFKNGLNITELPLTLSHDNLYGRIRVAGDGGVDGGIYGIVDLSTEYEIKDGQKYFKMWDGSKISEDKVLTVVNEELFDEAACIEFAEKLRADIRSRYSQTEFSVIPLPHLQMYDVIQILVYGTIMEAYLITGQNLSYTVDSQLITHRITAHHFAFAPVQEEIILGHPDHEEYTYLGIVPSEEIFGEGQDITDYIDPEDNGSGLPTDPNYLKYRRHSDDAIFYVAQKPVKSHISWDSIDAEDAVTGTNKTINGNTYQVRLLSGHIWDNGPGTSNDGQDEWNDLIWGLGVKLFGDTEGEGYEEEADGFFGTEGGWPGTGNASWMQETGSSASDRINRGFDGVSDFYYNDSALEMPLFGWRPVLQLI